MNELLNEDQRERRGRHVVDLICSSRGMASIRLVAALLVASPLAAASAVASSGAPVGPRGWRTPSTSRKSTGVVAAVVDIAPRPPCADARSHLGIHSSSSRRVVAIFCSLWSTPTRCAPACAIFSSCSR